MPRFVEACGSESKITCGEIKKSTNQKIKKAEKKNCIAWK
jgi:hypothetical protein